MRKTKHWLLTAAVLLCSLTADAHDFEVDGIFYNIISSTDLTVEVTFKGSSYNSYSNEYSGAVIIPENVVLDGATYIVVSIGEEAFRECINLSSIMIPNGVINIGNLAFYYCNSLTSITIPESVTSISTNALNLCRKLTEIVVDEGNTMYDSRDGCNAIILSRTNTLIYGCSTTIIPEGITSIGANAFRNCSNLTSITIPKSVTSIEEYAFQDCTNLTSVTILSDLTSIGYCLFTSCSSLVTINIPESVTSIGDLAFKYCSSLSSITIPKNLVSIGEEAFYGCSSLASTIIIPESVTSIGGDAFRDCGASELIVNCNITSAPNYIDGAFARSKFSKVTIGNNVTLIGASAFYECKNLIDITMPKSITSIGGSAFYGCSKLPSITIPEAVTSIEGSTFYGCSSLTSIEIPESVKSIDLYAFAECTLLSSVSLPEGLTVIKSYLFKNCTSLASITIPDNVKSIGKHAFYGCKSLTQINIPEGVTQIESSAFYGCSSATSVVLPKSLTNISSSAFANCTELLDVYCNAETIPTTSSNAFNGSYPEYATLHVPTTAVSTYKATTPWSSFGTIQGLTYEAVEEITLSHTTVTLNEGEHLTLTATVTPDYATDPSVTWSSNDENVAIVSTNGEITAIAPGSAIITATANDESGVSASCSVNVEKTTAVTITINQYGSGTYCSRYTLDFSEVEGLRAYAATGYDTETGIVTLTRVMTAKAGTGLFLKGTPGEYEVPVLESTSYNTLNMLAGTLESTVVNSTSDDGIYANYKYTILDGDAAPMFYQFADGSTLSAGKAYLQIPVAWLPAEAKSISLRFDDGETTDVEEMENLEQPSDVIYDLMGRRVTTPQRGSLYLINGKKIIY